MFRLANIAIAIAAVLGWFPNYPICQAEGPEAAHSDVAPAYPIVLRIPELALANSRREVIEERPVQRVILGTDITGTSCTKGILHVDIVPAENEAVFDVTFSGQVKTENVGRNGPAIILSDTITEFVCKRKVAFCADGQFRCEPTSISTKTQLVFKDVTTETRGLRDRVIRAIARRKVEETKDEVRAIADRYAQDDLRANFEQALDQRLHALAQRVATVQRIQRLMGVGGWNLAASSTDDCIHIGFCRSGKQSAEIAANYTSAPTTLMEVWLHKESFQNHFPSLTASLVLIGPTMSPMGRALPLLAQVLSSKSDTEEARNPERKGWVIFPIASMAAGRRSDSQRDLAHTGSQQ